MSSQDWWKGYHSRDSELDQKTMVQERQRQEIVRLKKELTGYKEHGRALEREARY